MIIRAIVRFSSKMQKYSLIWGANLLVERVQKQYKKYRHDILTNPCVVPKRYHGVTLIDVNPLQRFYRFFESKMGEIG